jgi:hypothetical protein
VSIHRFNIYPLGPERVKLGSKLYKDDELADPEPKTSISVMEAQVFAVLPLTVILMYLASVAAKVYFSGLSVVPLLVLVSLVVNVVPSVDVAITKL